MSYVITNERLGGLLHTLEGGDEINTATRRQLIEALYDLSFYHAIEEKSHKRGRQIAAKTLIAAAVTMRLVDDYKVRVKAAAWAAAPDANINEHEAIQRAYRKLRSGAFRRVNLHQSIVDDAAGRLDPDLIYKAAISSVKTGNK